MLDNSPPHIGGRLSKAEAHFRLRTADRDASLELAEIARNRESLLITLLVEKPIDKPKIKGYRRAKLAGSLLPRSMGRPHDHEP